jgi:hypothetical protein
LTGEPTSNGGEVKANVTPTTPRQTAGYRSAVTARPEARLDGNSAVGRRVRDLYRGLMERLNNPADITIQSDILALAELKAIGEAARLRLLEGRDQNTNGLVRVENLTRRAEARVGLEPGAGARTEPLDWRDLVPDDDEQTADDGVAP